MYRKRHQELTQLAGKIESLSKEIADAKSKEASLNTALNDQKKRISDLESKSQTTAQLEEQLKKTKKDLIDCLKRPPPF